MSSRVLGQGLDRDLPSTLVLGDGKQNEPANAAAITGRTRMATRHKVVFIYGDGIGPEVSSAVKRVLAAARAPLEWIEKRAGVAALEQDGEVLPAETLDAIERCGVALKGPCTTPVGDGFTSVNVQLRKKLNLFAAVRPVYNLPGVPTRFDNVDLIIIRENTEGLYSGVENQLTDDVVMSMKIATQSSCQRIAHWAFRFATQRRRKKLTVLHKANIMKLTDGLLLRNAREVHRLEYPNIEYDEWIIDAGCMKLVQQPERFDVLLLENLYGDVVSDLCAGLVGGLGVVAGANFGEETAIFEAVHGSAPDIAGQGIANPLALLMSAIMMLEYLAEIRDDPSCQAAADNITNAYRRTLADGEKTRDLGGELDTEPFADAVIARLAQ